MVFTLVNGRKRQYHPYNREALTNYCDKHWEDRSLKFSSEMVAQMVEYAGRPEGYETPDKIMGGDLEFHSMHKRMKTLVDLARSQQT